MLFPKKFWTTDFVFYMTCTNAIFGWNFASTENFCQCSTQKKSEFFEIFFNFFRFYCSSRAQMSSGAEHDFRLEKEKLSAYSSFRLVRFASDGLIAPLNWLPSRCLFLNFVVLAWSKIILGWIIQYMHWAYNAVKVCMLLKSGMGPESLLPLRELQGVKKRRQD